MRSLMLLMIVVFVFGIAMGLFTTLHQEKKVQFRVRYRVTHSPEWPK